MLPIDPAEIHNPSPRDFLAMRKRLYEAAVPRELARPVSPPAPAPSPVLPIRTAASTSPRMYVPRLDALMAQLRVVPTVPKPTQPAVPASVKVILQEVGAKHGFVVSAMRGKSRRGPVLRARQEAMYRLSMECPWMSYPSIGLALCRDHSTTWHGVRMHAERHGLPLPDRSKPWVRP